MTRAGFRASAKLIDIDKGYKRAVANIATAHAGIIGTVGVHKGEGQEGHEKSKSAKVIDIAIAHEFGVPERNISRRSFLRAAFAESTGFKTQILKAFTTQLLTKLGPISAMAIAMKDIEKFIRDRIRSGISPDLKEATKRKKGSSIPLIDTSQLIKAIKGKVLGQ